MELWTAMIAWLAAPVLVIAGAAVSRAELLGDLAGVACVWLVARQNLWNWPIGLVNTVLWAMVFWGARLYADAVLQGVFFVLNGYGWWTWRRGHRDAPLPVRRATRREVRVLVPVAAAATAAVAAFLHRGTDSPAPVADAAVLTLSLVATYGQAHKILASWWVWIAVDIISVPLYVSRGLYPTAAVYALFLCLCVKGLRDWSRDLAAQR